MSCTIYSFLAAPSLLPLLFLILPIAHREDVLGVVDYRPRAHFEHRYAVESPQQADASHRSTEIPATDDFEAFARRRGRRHAGVTASV